MLTVDLESYCNLFLKKLELIGTITRVGISVSVDAKYQLISHIGKTVILASVMLQCRYFANPDHKGHHGGGPLHISRAGEHYTRKKGRI